MPSLQHLSRHTLADEIWQDFDEDGGLIIDDFLNAKTLQALRGDIMPAVNRHHAGTAHGRSFVKAFHGDTTKRITGLADISRAWVEILCDPLYKAMADHYLGEDNYYFEHRPADLHRTRGRHPKCCIETSKTGPQQRGKGMRLPFRRYLHSPTSPQPMAPPSWRRAVSGGPERCPRSIQRLRVRQP